MRTVKSDDSPPTPVFPMGRCRPSPFARTNQDAAPPSLPPTLKVNDP